MAQEGSQRPKGGISWGWVIAGLMVVVIAAALGMQAYEDSIQYYMTTDEFVMRQENFAGKNVKLAGNVKEDSLVSENNRHEFTITFNDKDYPVVYLGLAPDTFKEGAEVIVEGRGPASGPFMADGLMAKCASKYEVGGLPPIQLQN